MKVFKRREYLVFPILGLILLVFLLVFIELNNLRHNEKVIAQVYENQLRTILFTVNEYSNDVVKSIQLEINYSVKQKDSLLPDIRQNFPFIKDIFFFDDTLISELTDTLERNPSKFNRLTFDQYLQGYSNDKDLGLQSNEIENSGLTLFSQKTTVGDKIRTLAVVFDVAEFIDQIIAPKIIEITEGQSSILLLDKNMRPIGRSYLYRPMVKIEKSIPLNTFQGYNLGILQKGNSLNALTVEQDRNYLYLAFLLCTLLVGAGWLIFRTFKKQMELVQQKTDFVSNISHEIRTPLSLIYLYAETIDNERAITKGDHKKFVSIIAQEAARLSKLVNKTLVFSKIEKTEFSYTMRQNNLNGVLKNVYDNYVPYFEKHGFTHQLILNDSTENLDFDSEAIKDVFINLVENAIKYSFKNKVITIETGTRLPYAFFEVTDQGIGIDEKDKKKAFRQILSFAASRYCLENHRIWHWPVYRKTYCRCPQRENRNHKQNSTWKYFQDSSAQKTKQWLNPIDY